MPKPERIDLAASAARVISARRLAAEQARIVEASAGGADILAIDLLLLLQESVLVFDETHTMLKTLAAREAAVEAQAWVPQAQRDRRKTTRLRPLIVAAKVVVLVIVSAFVLELIDPAPMDVMAFLKNTPSPQRSDHP